MAAIGIIYDNILQFFKESWLAIIRSRFANSYQLCGKSYKIIADKCKHITMDI